MGSSRNRIPWLQKRTHLSTEGQHFTSSLSPQGLLPHSVPTVNTVHIFGAWTSHSLFELCMLMTESQQKDRMGGRGMKGICWPFIGTHTEPLFSFSWLNYVALLGLIAVELKPLMLLSKWRLILYVLWKTDCRQRAWGYDVKTPLQMFPEQRAKSTPLFLCQNFLLFGLVLACLWKWASLRCVWRMAPSSGHLSETPVLFFQSCWMRILLIFPTNPASGGKYCHCLSQARLTYTQQKKD